MRFEIQKRPHPNVARYHGADYALAYEFAQRLHKELGDFLKAVVLFGSAARPEKTTHEHDIDVLLIVNDLTIIATEEVINAYRIITEKTAAGVTKRLHINTMKMTAVWDYARNGDPLIVNILRDGVPLFDTGFIEPLQVLLYQGRIKPTKEAVWAYYARAPLTMKNSERQILRAAVDLYWACVDSAHAALMHMGDMPGTPEHLPAMINDHLVKKGLAPKSDGSIAIRVSSMLEFFQ
ncbi:MAG: nucleotidyltransferase domain-containing protein [Nanoarchaeota archaeon]